MNKVCAIILAGGRGSRMGANVSKQFIEIKGKPMLYYTIKAFETSQEIQDIILVLPKDEIEFCKKEIIDKFNLKIGKIVEGGTERQYSVYNGLKAIENCDIVLIHDGARPFITQDILKNSIIYAKQYGAAAPGVMPKDTIKVKDRNGFSIDTPNRNDLVAVQTPQSFNFNTIMNGHEYIKENNISVTDDTMVAEIIGQKVFLYEGDYKNIKITTPEDLILAEQFIL
ncbi:2-C-methyl-D-erythritol 4-phosphate cytidylyltransferase [Clostridium cavendishii DSM 21758]|uniref:2-C-methyl-D-erythritol 4-phosphate cytidylyltransferase n=1 Tax=Clostridium cavendishii DSM 21758 TaxID=1121302 RepID=A0A1M6V2P6_9CLOT|nr:2-C-methyl-D-erythritol 4-phosphate cytidylyltransferase [Clostridium cavendishii]SHK75782.1 2-C-methyl-D-erythritol 4-phosphate cytidylyltransferase [Clostridium cavendishii DSM 21758]